MPLRSARGRGVLAATVLASGMAFLDTTVVNVALPSIARELHAGLAGLQGVVDAYLLTLSSLLLLGGALGDLLGRRAVFAAGVALFAVTSALCGLAPTLPVLWLARALQGCAAALLVPGSLAIVRGSFAAEEQGAAVGAWSALSGVTTAAGPLLGGWLVQAASWRFIFLLNLPVAAAALWLTARCVTPSPRRAARLDWPGALLAAAGLAGLVLALIAGPGAGWSPPVLWGGAAGLGALAAFLLRERRTPHPMLPLDLFRSRQLSGANLTTFAVYFALSAALFLVVLRLQARQGWSPLASGLALAPVTLLMLLLSPASGRLAGRIGFRLPMTAGPLVAAAGLAVLAEVERTAPLLGAVSLLGLGLATTVAPLTTAAITGAGEDRAGIASGLNNAVARVAGLLGVAVIPGLAGVDPAAADTPAFAAACRVALRAAALACAAGGLAAFATLPPPPRRPGPPAPPGPGPRRAAAGAASPGMQAADG
ncbi:MFS transporter [Anaeromyxobacter paludicola]|uniref:MFS transporter n=1 Tax=Anaeromyxobacter paludicola TaxID=2918171 RepID=A0ABN6NBH7_9BACT|nr:MFS transporter [Anaeromyxobacter paludicola]BDG10602.1 MFS transporter [Anaeromyxobacter paludicola]